jgi:hypothetical protein
MRTRTDIVRLYVLTATLLTLLVIPIYEILDGFRSWLRQRSGVG